MYNKGVIQPLHTKGLIFTMPVQQLHSWFGKVFFLLLVLCTAMPAWAIQPIQVAVLPPINAAGLSNMADTQIIQSTIKHPFKYPYYSLLPAETVLETTKNYLAENKNFRLTDEKSLAQLASNLSADLVVVVELSRFDLSRTSSFWNEDTYINSDIVLKCYAYSPLLKRYDVIKVAKCDQEAESVNTNSEFFLKDLTNQILAKLPYKRIPLTGFTKPDPLIEEQPLD